MSATRVKLVVAACDRNGRRLASVVIVRTSENHQDAQGLAIRDRQVAFARLREQHPRLPGLLRLVGPDQGRGGHARARRADCVAARSATPTKRAPKKRTHYGRRPCPSCGYLITTNALGRAVHRRNCAGRAGERAKHETRARRA